MIKTLPLYFDKATTASSPVTSERPRVASDRKICRREAPAMRSRQPSITGARADAHGNSHATTPSIYGSKYM